MPSAGASVVAAGMPPSGCIVATGTAPTGAALPGESEAVIVAVVGVRGGSADTMLLLPTVADRGRMRSDGNVCVSDALSCGGLVVFGGGVCYNSGKRSVREQCLFFGVTGTDVSDHATENQE